MARTKKVEVEWTHPETEEVFTVRAEISGRYQRATFNAPAESPEVDICTVVDDLGLPDVAALAYLLSRPLELAAVENDLIEAVIADLVED